MRRFVPMARDRLWCYNVLPLLALSAMLCQSAKAEEEPLFPFTVSYESPNNVTSAAGWLQRRPASRFVGPRRGILRPTPGRSASVTNLCFEACFPREQPTARRPTNLPGNQLRACTTWTIARSGARVPAADSRPRNGQARCLIYQLKDEAFTRTSIFTSPVGSAGRGLSPASSGRSMTRARRLPATVDPAKKYARDLLTHESHTPRRLRRRDQWPVEINERDLCPVGGGNLDNLPEPYLDLSKAVNAWLHKYGTTEKLRRAWNVGSGRWGRDAQRGDWAEAGCHWRSNATPKPRCMVGRWWPRGSPGTGCGRKAGKVA